MLMKKEAENYRIRSGYMSSPTGYPCGAFEIPYKSSTLFAIVYDGSSDGWEHVSVSLRSRCPNWQEMCFVKDLFWGEDETVMQFHVPKSQHINNHPYCLHMWKRVGLEVELPPSEAVGVKDDV